MKFSLTLAAFKEETPVIARRIGNALFASGMVIAGTSAAMQHDMIAVGSAIAAGFGKFMTEFFHEESPVVQQETAAEEPSTQEPPK